MKWCVFRQDDPNTWPEFDCPLLVCWINGLNYHLRKLKWDNKNKKFINDNCMRVFFPIGDIFYVYIGYIPKGYKMHKTLRCLNDDNCKVGCADDGYCMYDCECEQQRVVNEYEIEPKRIWKEFDGT